MRFVRPYRTKKLCGTPRPRPTASLWCQRLSNERKRWWPCWSKSHDDRWRRRRQAEAWTPTRRRPACQRLESSLQAVRRPKQELLAMLNQLTLLELSRRLAGREVSAREAMQACLDRIKKVDGQIHAFLSLDETDALAQAGQADEQIARGQAGKPLLGVPIAIKDVIAVKNQPLNCGSKILGKFISPYDATVIQRLRAAGAVIF